MIRHYSRISQEVLGSDFNVEIGQGTCTMKYSPKINERFVRSPKMAELHPLQDESTVQGMLEMTYQLDLYLREISGMDKFSFQPGSGTQALFTQASIVRKYHESRGEESCATSLLLPIFLTRPNPQQQQSKASKSFMYLLTKTATLIWKR